MKTNGLFATLFVALSLLFTGCNPEQSEFTLDSLDKTALVRGTIVYDAGVDINSDNAYMVNNIVPAAERTVYVEVPYSEYSGNAENRSNKIYETVTDSAGNFEIEIPTTPEGINNVTIRMKEFVTVRSEYKKMENNAPVFETKMYRFTWTHEVPDGNLKPGAGYSVNAENEAQVCDLELVELEGLDETITFNGTINVAYETGFRNGAFKKLANASVVFVAEYELLPDEPIEFGTVTDADGKYSITLPIESYEEGFKSLSVKALGVGQSYKHYYEADKSVDLTGAYDKQNILDGIVLTEIIEGMEYRMPEQFLAFTPNFNNGITNNVNPSTWTQNLAGWERYDGFTQTQTVKGQVLLATETSYGVGAFANPKLEAKVTINYPGMDDRGGSKTVYVPTDKDGNFTFEVPVRDKQEKLSIDFENIAATTEMNHFLSDGKSMKLDGRYVKCNDNIKEPGTEWYEAGKVYYLFNPTTSGDIEWNGNLAGWRVADAEYNDWKTPVKITADVKMPYESSFAVGSYKAADNILANIDVDGTVYATLVKNGKVDMTIYVEAESSEPSVNLTSISKEEKNFRHFDIKGKERAIAGRYEQYYSMPQADRENWNELGDVYCRFIPEGAVDNWDIFGNLAGWQVAAALRNDYRQQAQITATVQLPVETALAEGDYVPANGVLAVISVKGISYTTLINNGTVNFMAYTSDANDEPTVTIVSINKEEKNFRHFDVKNVERKLEGQYEIYSMTDVADRETWNQLGDVYCKFQPAGYVENWDEWFKHIAGWVRMDDCTDVKDVTGEIYRAEETSYGEGIYNAQPNTLVYTIVKGVKYVAATDANGAYTIPVRLNPNSPEPTAASVVPFFVLNSVKYTHYLPNDKYEEAEYVYSDNLYFEEPRIAGYDPWNELRAYYYYAPTYTLRNQGLLGWVNTEKEVALKGEYKTIMINGSIKRAIETTQGSSTKATWTSDNAVRLVTVYFNGVKYTAVSNYGSFSLPISVDRNDNNTTCSLRITATEGDATAKEVFTHYPNHKSNESENIYGYYVNADNYAVASTVNITNGSVNLTKKSVKMLFYPTDPTNPENWDSYVWNPDVEQ